MQKIIEKMRGWLTGLLVLSLTVIAPFQDPQIALASDYMEEMQETPVEFQLLNSNYLEWKTEGSPVQEPMEEVLSDTSVQTDMTVEVRVSNAPIVEYPTAMEAPQKRLMTLPQWRIEISYEQLELLERCVMAEGGGESYDCQVAIACVIINRVLSDKYPDSIDGVIKQKGQFSTWPGMIKKAVPTNEVKQAVREALTSEVIPENVLYFRAGRYHKWATRYCRMDNTYFSTP